MRARAVIDGQQVEIPVLRIIRTVGTQEDRKTGEWKNPYRKPTQVDEEKIHRPTGEVLLRNSAK